jgi:hypothetical protein
MEDDVLDLPLFGATTRSNPTNPNPDPDCPPVQPCCDGDFPEGEPGCFSCRPNHGGAGGYGHFLPKELGSTAGYFSFACFNPQSYLYNERIVTEPGSRNRIEIPTCSLWAYMRSIRNYIYSSEKAYQNLCGENQLCCDLGGENCCGETAADINALGNGTNQGDSWWKNIDPGGTNSAGTSNVRLVVDELKKRVRRVTTWDFNVVSCTKDAGYHLVTPNVFLWDKDAFLNASAVNGDRWKHIYTIGFSNILWDSGCTDNGYDPDSEDFNINNEMFYIDNVAHAAGASAANACRLLGWMGCDGDPSEGQAGHFIRQMQCNGRDYGNENPDTPNVGGFYCKDCHSDYTENDCVNAFWKGYDLSVTACVFGGAIDPDGDGEPPPYDPCSPASATAQSIMTIDQYPHVLFSRGSGNWGGQVNQVHYLIPKGSLSIPSGTSPLGKTGGHPACGLTNGYAPQQTKVKKLGTRSAYLSFVKKCSTDSNYGSQGCIIGEQYQCPSPYSGFGDIWHEDSHYTINEIPSNIPNFHTMFNSMWAACILDNNKIRQWGGGIRSDYATTNIPLGLRGTVVSSPKTGYSDPTIYVKFPPADTLVSDVCTSAVHGLALTTSKSLVAWGISGNDGPAWYPKESTQKSVLNTPQDSSYINIACSSYGQFCGWNWGSTNWYKSTSVSAAVKADGTLRIWGDNDWGQVTGNHPTTPYTTGECRKTYTSQEASSYIVPKPTDATLAADGGCTAVFLGGRAVGVITNSPDQNGVNQYKVRIWGWNRWSMGCDECTTCPNLVPGGNPVGNYTIVPSKLRNVKQLAILDPICVVALKHDGTLDVWGSINNPAGVFSGSYNTGYGSIPPVSGPLWKGEDIRNRLAGGVNRHTGTPVLIDNGLLNETDVVEIKAIANWGVAVRRSDGSVKTYCCRQDRLPQTAGQWPWVWPYWPTAWTTWSLQGCGSNDPDYGPTYFGC